MDYDFYVKESTKPLFAKHELLAVENLYRLRCLMEFLKIIKTRVTISLYSLFTISHKKDNMLITPSQTKQFIYKSAWLWNEFCNNGSFNFNSFCHSVKNKLQKSLMNAQNRYGVEQMTKQLLMIINEIIGYL